MFFWGHGVDIAIHCTNQYNLTNNEDNYSQNQHDIYN